MNSFIPNTELIYEAAKEWYGATDLNSLCLAELRLMKGDKIASKNKSKSRAMGCLLVFSRKRIKE